MAIRFNEDQEMVKIIREGLKKTGGYCPCRRERTPENKCMCKEFRDQIKDPNFKVIQRQRTLSRPTYLQRELVQIAMELLTAHWNLNAPIRLLNITGTDLVPANEATEQISFLEQDEQTGHEKLERLEDAMASIRQKYGRSVIGYGRQGQKEE